MSEANNTWRVEVDGREHEIEAEHSTFTGKITVTVDGEEVAEDRMLMRKKDLVFDIAGEEAVVSTQFGNAGFSADTSLHGGGRYVEPLKR